MKKINKKSFQLNLFTFQTILGWKKEKEEAVIQRPSEKNVFWKYAANLQENTHVEVWFATLLK